MLGVLLVGAAPARAATITFEDVVRAVGASGQVRPADEVRLRFASQSGRAAGQQDPPAQGTESSATQQQSSDPAAGGAQTVTSGAAEPSLSQTGGGGQVETIDLGDVTGTVCDCGEIPPLPGARRGFPWWLLGGVPLICVSGICFDTPDEECIINCGPNGTPTPTPTPEVPIPEPATLLLFGSGLLALGARARRRFGRKEFDAGTAAPAEEV